MHVIYNYIDLARVKPSLCTQTVQYIYIWPHHASIHTIDNNGLVHSSENLDDVVYIHVHV